MVEDIEVDTFDWYDEWDMHDCGCCMCCGCSCGDDYALERLEDELSEDLQE